MTVKLQTEHHMEFLSLKGGCTCSSESTLVKMPRCWKSHVPAQLTQTLKVDDLLCSNFNSLHFGQFFMLLFSSANFTFSTKKIQEHYQSVKRIESSSGTSSVGPDQWA